MSAERIGGLLAALGKIGDGTGYVENTTCGGALLYVTKKQALGMLASGKYRWVQDPARMPDEGRHSWRIACRNEVMQVRRRAELPPDATPEQRANAPTYTITYALCSVCSGLELAIRKRLREEAKKAEEEARSRGPRRRSFSEKARDDEEAAE